MDKVLARLALVLVLASTLGAQAPLDTLHLAEVYQWNNTRYFKNKLPPVPVIFDDGRTLEEQELWGYAGCRMSENKPTSIILNARLKEKGMRAILYIYLLHEQVHVKQCVEGSTDFHGPKFQKEMRRLANEGAFDNYW